MEWFIYGMYSQSLTKDHVCEVRLARSGAMRRRGLNTLGVLARVMRRPSSSLSMIRSYVHADSIHPK